jgi:hypothetical protein
MVRTLWLALGIASLPSTFGEEADPSDPIAGRTHWAFQPLSQSKPSQRAEWAPASIDRLVVQRRRNAGLGPVAGSSPRALLRRTYFQLIGLPPTPQEIEAYLNDTQPEAFTRLVDRLLNSPRFGERWGRHWLDLARYADSNGLDENFLFREAWRYRNWVIDAVNMDLPFDQFILNQIAGDLLPHETISQRDRQRIAAGFLAIGPKVLLGNNPNNQRMEVADEQIDTIGRAFLGLTVACARCHDHKFEPIPTADYYALAGILTSTQVMERRHMLGQQRVMERLVGLGVEGVDLDSAYENYWRELPKTKKALKEAQAALASLKNGDACCSSMPTLEEQQAKVNELKKFIASPPAIPPRAMIPSDKDSPSDEAIRIAGQFDRKGEQVGRGFLQVLSDQTPDFAEGQSGRVELAHWLTDVESGAGHLTARVMANRIWYQLIGRGLVRTVDNFGRTGEGPSHPELLDHLATELIASGWSVKALAREIVLSRTFALSSEHDDTSHAIDPENRFLWRAHRRRLDPESLRDAMLATADRLDLGWTESTVSYLGDQATAVGQNKNRRRTDFPCRSVYLPVIRNDLPEIFEVFDFADPHAATGARPKTTAATQGLFILNDEMVMDAAKAMAQRLVPYSDDRDKIERVFEWALGTMPSNDEQNEILSYVRTTANRLKTNDEPEPKKCAWTMACHAVLSMSRFQFLD